MPPSGPYPTIPTPMVRPQQWRSGRSARARSWTRPGVRSASSVLPRPHATTRPAPTVVSTTAAWSRSATRTLTMALPAPSGTSGTNPSTTANSRGARSEMWECAGVTVAKYSPARRLGARRSRPGGPPRSHCARPARRRCRPAGRLAPPPRGARPGPRWAAADGRPSTTIASCSGRLGKSSSGRTKRELGQPLRQRLEGGAPAIGETAGEDEDAHCPRRYHGPVRQSAPRRPPGRVRDGRGRGRPSRPGAPVSREASRSCPPACRAARSRRQPGGRGAGPRPATPSRCEAPRAGR